VLLRTLVENESDTPATSGVGPAAGDLTVAVPSSDHNPTDAREPTHSTIASFTPTPPPALETASNAVFNAVEIFDGFEEPSNSTIYP
jgi:hypothetical protein